MSGNPIVWNNQLLQLRKNEGLAVLGDTVLKSFLCKKWYETKRPKGMQLEVTVRISLTTCRAMDCS